MDITCDTQVADANHFLIHTTRTIIHSLTSKLMCNNKAELDLTHKW